MNKVILKIDRYDTEETFWSNFVNSLESDEHVDVLWITVDNALLQYNARMPNRDSIMFGTGEDAAFFKLRWS